MNMVKVDVKKIAVKYCTDVVDTSVDKAFIQASLLEWYRAKRRMMPWRGDLTSIPRSAYGTWISEVMLQQTRVETVIEYWNRWMAVFPDVRTLAMATPDEVNKMWAGLGYYRRAQMLLKGAIKVVEDYDGVLPDTTQELLNIPGIGPYTAGAIASIAYDKAEPLVDGNVMRVFSRLLAMKLEVGGGAMEKQCWKIAADLVPSESPGDFNQALMELGATVCKPTSPDCASCPLGSVCHARILVDHARSHGFVSTALPSKTAATAAGVLDLFTKKRKNTDAIDVEDTVPAAVVFQDDLDYDLALLPRDVTEFPRKVAKKKAKELTFSVCVLRTRSFADDSAAGAAVGAADRKLEYRYLFVRRPATGLLANQWEFPSIGITSEAVELSAEDTAEGREGDAEGVPAVIGAADLWAPFPAYFVDSLHMRWQLGDSVDGSCDCKTGVKDESMCSPTNALLLETQASNDFEPILHVFSHQRHTMHITLRDVQVVSRSIAEASAAAPVASKWMTAAEIVEAGITTGCKKILTQVTKTTAPRAGKAMAENKAAAAVKAPRNAPMKVKAEEKVLSEHANVQDVIEIIDDGDEVLVAKGPLNAFDLMKKASAKTHAPATKRAKK